MRGRRAAPTLALGCLAIFLLVLPLQAREEGCRRLLERAEGNTRLSLSLSNHAASGTSFLHGSYRVFEDREAKRGREIELNLVVLPATGDDPAPDPMFVFHGGPGAAATTYLGHLVQSWIRERRDVVLIDQRGTGGSNPLHVPLPGGDDDLQGYLDPVFRVEFFRAALPRLEEIEAEPRYRKAFPDLRRKFMEVLTRLEKEIDLSVVKKIRMPPLALPKANCPQAPGEAK